MEFKIGQLTENQRKRPFDKVRKLRKTAEQNLKVYFYVTAHTDGSKVYHYDEEYNTPIKTFARPGHPPLKTKFRYVVTNQFHSDRIEESIIIKGFHVDKHDLNISADFGCIQMTGYIPKGSYYYEDEYGQIVTDTLVCDKEKLTYKELAKTYSNWKPKEPIDPLHTFAFDYKNFTNKLKQVRLAEAIKRETTDWRMMEDKLRMKFTIPMNELSKENTLEFLNKHLEMRSSINKDMDEAYQSFREALPSIHSMNDIIDFNNIPPMNNLTEDGMIQMATPTRDIIKNMINDKPLVYTDIKPLLPPDGTYFEFNGDVWVNKEPEEIIKVKLNIFQRIRKFFSNK